MKQKSTSGGTSACKTATTCGLKYRRSRDAGLLNASQVDAAANAALERRGLLKPKRRVSPAEAFNRALFFQQGAL